MTYLNDSNVDSLDSELTKRIETLSKEIRRKEFELEDASKEKALLEEAVSLRDKNSMFDLDAEEVKKYSSQTALLMNVLKKHKGKWMTALEAIEACDEFREYLKENSEVVHKNAAINLDTTIVRHLYAGCVPLRVKGGKTDEGIKWRRKTRNRYGAFEYSM